MKTLLLILVAALMPAQNLRPPERRSRMFEDYLAVRGLEITRNHLAGIGSPADWQKQRPAAHKRLLYMLGLDPFPPKTALNAKITGTLERGDYRVEKIVFQSMPGLYVTGNLYLLSKPQGRAPAVVYLSGHSPGPVGAKATYQHHGIWLARHGYAAFVLDTIEYGEIAGVHHGTHNLGMWYWLSLGYTPAGPEVWNAIRALDYLETRSEIDTRKTALTGISGGGAITWFAAAADERFQVAAPVCATWTAGHQAKLDTVHENCDCIYFHNTYQADLPLAASLIAPRPLKILNARRDSMFPPDGYKEVFRQARRIYEMLGAAEKVEEYEHDAPHQDIPAFRKEAYEWINRWVKNDRTPYDEGEIRKEPPENLRVIDRYPADARNGSIHRSFLAAHRLALPKSLAAWKARRAVLLAELKDKVFRAFPTAKPPFEASKTKEGGWTSRYSDSFQVEFATEAGIRVGGQLYVPRGAAGPHPMLIHARSAEDIVYPVDQDYLLELLGNHVVLVLNPRGVEMTPNNYKRATLQRTAALLGVTIESMQVWDILRSIDYLLEGERLPVSSISVFGRKHMGALGLYAAAMDERITRVVLDDPPFSHWQGPPLLNVLRITDLAETAAIMAPREIVSLTPLPESFRHTRIIYGLYGKAAVIREAGALGDALKVWEARNR